jgi:hypothetical protein
MRNVAPKLISKTMHHPPSIPSGDYKYGYKVNDDGRNIVSLKSLERDLIGP